MSRKGAVTIPTWIFYVVIIAVVVVVAWFAVPGAKEWMLGIGTAAYITLKGWAGTIGDNPIWQGYWYVFVLIGGILVFSFGRWTYKKQDDLLHFMAVKARLRAAQVDDGLGMNLYGGQGGPTGPGGAQGLTPDELKKQQEVLP